MPLLAQFIGWLATQFVGVFSQVMAFGLALKLGAYAAWIVVLGAFLGSVVVCLGSLWNVVSGIFGTGGVSLTLGAGGGLAWFGLGLGMFIPSNAGMVMSCVASVWFASSLYKIQRDGIHNYAK